MIEPRMGPRWLPPAVLLLVLACEQPPDKQVDRVAPPKTEQEREDAAEFRKRAHERGFSEAMPVALAAIELGDRFTAYRVGRGPAGLPMLTLGDRTVIAEPFARAETAVSEIDESYLAPSSVVILRAVRFGLSQLYDELERQPRLRHDPFVAVQAVDDVLDELVYRVVRDDCDTACEALAAELALALPSTREQLAAASPAATARAELVTERLAARSRALATSLDTAPLQGRYPSLAAGLGELATALDQHQRWLAELRVALPAAIATHEWTAKPAPIRAGGPTAIERLPDVLGSQTVSRRLAVEQRLILDPPRDIARVAEHVGRWTSLRSQLVTTPIEVSPPAPVDVARCEAALGRITAGLAKLDAVEPPQLRCDRYVALLGGQPRDEPALVLELLDLGVIEPQRRALRSAELPEIALVTGPTSADVHTHLRRVMLLAPLAEPAALARAIDEGTRALCLAEATLWVHTELGFVDAARDAVGAKCNVLDAKLGDHGDPLLDQVLGDPRGSLTGLGLSLIGDEPAKMVGFDRFFWAPLGLMQTLATPQGMHPDQFTLPSDAPPEPNPGELGLQLEELSPGGQPRSE